MKKWIFLILSIQICFQVISTANSTNDEEKGNSISVEEWIRSNASGIFINDKLYSEKFNVRGRNWNITYKKYTFSNLSNASRSLKLTGREKYGLHFNFSNDYIKFNYRLNVDGISAFLTNYTTYNGGFAIGRNSCCTTGSGPGAGYFYHGAGHGGKGGGSWKDYGQSYEDEQLILGGSTGGQIYKSDSGTGGGILLITAKRKFMLGYTGILSANGFDVPNSTFEHCSGGSSGGYIGIKAVKIVISGLISANGGNSGYTTTTNSRCGSGGAGGVVKLNALTFSINKYPTVNGGIGLEDGERGRIWIGTEFTSHILIDTNFCYLRSNDFDGNTLEGQLYNISGYDVKTCEIAFQYNLRINSTTNIELRGENSLRIKILNGSAYIYTDLNVKIDESLLGRHSVLGGYHNLGSYNGPGNNSGFAFHASQVRQNYGISPFQLIGGSSCIKDSSYIPTVGGGALEIEVVNGNVSLGASIHADAYQVFGKVGGILQSCGASGGSIKIKAQNIIFEDPILTLTAQGHDGLKGGDGGAIILIGKLIDFESSFIHVDGGKGTISLENGKKGFFAKISWELEPIAATKKTPTTTPTTTSNPLNNKSTTTAMTVSKIEVVTMPPTRITQPKPDITFPLLTLFPSHITSPARTFPTAPALTSKSQPVSRLSQKPLDTTKSTTKATSTKKFATGENVKIIIDETYKEFEENVTQYNESKVLESLKTLTKMDWDYAIPSEIALVVENVVNISSKVLTIAVEEVGDKLEETVEELKDVLEDFGSIIGDESNDAHVYSFSKPRIEMEISITKVQNASEKNFPASQNKANNFDNIISLPPGFSSQQESLLEDSLMATTSIVLDVSNYSHLHQSNSSEGQENIASSIFSFTIHSDIVEPFPVPILIKQKYEKQGNGRVKTGYKNVTENRWNFNGLTTKFINGNYIITELTHLTSFAVLVQIKDIEISEIDKQALSFITYIGCSLSLFACLLTYAVLATIRSVSSERVRIHKNLVTALGIALALFVIGIEIKHDILCTIVAVLLHYFFTAVFGWMFAEGVHLYTKVVRVFSAGRSNMKIYHFLGWGIPAIFVAISSGINSGAYGANNICWISFEGGMVWSFIAPVIFVILLNVCIMMRVLHILVSSVNGPLEIKSDKSKQQIKVAVKGMVLLLPILGLTWVFGMLAVNEETIFFQYIFCILNSFQGVFIFLLYCVGNAEVRSALKRLREKHFGSKFSSQAKSISDCDGSEMKKRESNDSDKKNAVIQLSSPEDGMQSRSSQTASTDLNTR